ncbi:MAG: hypothetical protein K2Y71_06230 [Xanthobacteraceae bacterium]|nr:hypothetical protein [Xanthobacteraceae bacterium]
MSRRFSPLAWLAALALLAFSMMAAPARSEPTGEGARILNCYFSRNIDSCVETFHSGRVNPHVIAVPATADEAAQARDRRWFERCNPVVRQDRYGMPRYTYSAQGCEFGRLD